MARTFWPQIRGQRRLIILSLLSLLLSIIARVLEPWPIKLIFDWIIVPPDEAVAGSMSSWLAPPAAFESTGMLLAALAIALIVFATARALFDYLSTVGMAVTATRVVAGIRARLFEHLQQLSLEFHHKAKSGDLVTRFTYDAERLREAAVTAMLPLVANLLTIAAMFGVMFWFNWQLALIPLMVLPFFYLSSIRASGQIQTAVREHRRRDGALAASVAEAIGSIKFVQALSLGKLQQKVFDRQNKKGLKEGAKVQRLGAGLERRVDIILAVASAMVLWKGVHLVLSHAITPGSLILFVTYMKFVFRPMRQVAKHLAKISRATASGERIIDIMETVPKISDRADAVEIQTVSGRIEFDHVSFGYGSNRNTLNDICLTINPGEHVALVGPSGSGKSTILALLLRLYDPAQGRILIDGHDIRDFKVDSIRRQFSMVLQDSVLFAVSVRDNILYGNLDADQSAVEQAARLANAHGFITMLEHGYDTVVGERGATLSGGQLQRIAIARAVVRNAPIMVLDEPTLGLDNLNRSEVNAALERCLQGKTTLLVSHDLSASRHFERILVVEDSRIVEQGSHDELIRMRGRYRKLYLEQFARPHTDGRDYAVEQAQKSHALVG